MHSEAYYVRADIGPAGNRMGSVIHVGLTDAGKITMHLNIGHKDVNLAFTKGGASALADALTMAVIEASDPTR